MAADRLTPEQRDLAASVIPLAHRMAWGFARKTASHVPVDELIAEALFSATYSAARYDAGKGIPFDAYATMCIKHRLIWLSKYHRLRKVSFAIREADVAAADGDRLFLAETVIGNEPDPAIEAEARDLYQKVRANISARLFRVLRMLYVEGLTHGDIAVKDRCKRRHVQATERRALKAAREVLEGGGA